MDMGTIYLIMVGGATLFLLIMLLTGLGHNHFSGSDQCTYKLQEHYKCKNLLNLSAKLKTTNCN